MSGLTAQQISVDFATIENAIEELPVVRCEIEHEGESFPVFSYT